MEAASYLGVPLELSDGTRVGTLAALSREYCAFEPADEQLFVMLARVLAPSSSARPTSATCAASTTCSATRPAGWAR